MVCVQVRAEIFNKAAAGYHIEIGNDRWPQPKVEEHDEAENWESIKDDDSVRKDKA